MKSLFLTYRWYLYVAVASALLTFWLTSKSDESTYQKTVTTQEQTIAFLQHTIEVLKETTSEETKTYDPATGHLISDTTKVDTKDETKTTDSSTKTVDTSKSTTTASTAVNLSTNTVLVGYGYDLDLNKVYSAEYIKRFSILDVGAEVQTEGKQVSASALIGISF